MTHASVFSGIGGPEVAAAMLGWKNAFHCEINPFGRAVLDYWFPEAESYEDITKTDFSKWGGQIDVLTGGFPCQPFSYTGKRRGAEDDRYLWPFMFKCIDQIRPTWVVAENVSGILTMVEQGKVVRMEDAPALFDEDSAVHRYEYRSTFTLERICRDLETHGYAVQPVLIPAASVGAPHKRDRVFIIGYRTESKEISGNIRPASNANHSRLEEARPKQSAAMPGRTYLRISEWDEIDKRSSEIAGCGRWDDFPHVPITHRGHDGFPFDVDNLAIPFAEWRNESIKAHGNAICPQVMYEIFRVIDEMERTQQPGLF